MVNSENCNLSFYIIVCFLKIYDTVINTLVITLLFSYICYLILFTKNIF